VPVMVTLAPTALLEGVKLEIAGVGKTVKLDTVETVTPFNASEIEPVDAPTGTEVVMLVAVDAITTADTPLNVTRLFEGVVLKLFPEIVTVAPTAPLAGANPISEGDGRTVKLDGLELTVTPLVVTVIEPVEAPTGTVVVMLVVVEAVANDNVPLNLTKLLAGVVLKFVPSIVTVAPTAPLTGLNPEMVGEGRTVKLVLEMVTPLEVTLIGPVPAPAGTVVVITVAFDAVILAGTPLNVTTGVPVKFVPVIVTVAPTAPLEGLNPEMVGGGNTMKLETLVKVIPLTVT
jgi:hypothetical protein